MSRKLDMNKAYDRVDWDYFEQTMVILGIPERFINLIMLCVKLVSFSVFFDGVPNGPIVPSRGLRQGDPLFPYLFLLCTEVLVSLLNQLATGGGLRGIRVCKGAPMIYHLLFTNNILIFCNATSTVSTQLLDTLQTYAKALGQCVNNEKTQMVFNHNVRDQDKEAIQSFWGVRGHQQYEKYLGLPSIIGRSNKRAFAEIKAKVWQKIQNWKGKVLPQRGKEILLKAVALRSPLMP